MGWAGDPLRAAHPAGMVEGRCVATKVGDQGRWLVKNPGSFMCGKRAHRDVYLLPGITYPVYMHQQLRTSCPNISWQTCQLLHELMSEDTGDSSGIKQSFITFNVAYVLRLTQERMMVVDGLGRRTKLAVCYP